MIKREIEDNRATGQADRSQALPQGSDGLWLTWEVQRRTTELAGRLGVVLVRLLYEGPRWRRYPVLAVATIAEIARRRPRWLIVQNPSLIMTGLVCLLKPLFGFRLIVDRHTNFMLAVPPCFRRRVFVAISDFTLRHSDLTIVTNDFLKDLVAEKGGRAIVLQDPIPEFEPSDPGLPKTGRQGFFVCTYAPDEPYAEVILAASQLTGQGRLVVSGRPPRSGFAEPVAQALAGSDVVEIAGFMSEERYVDVMQQSDFVMVLTRSEYCLVCGAYEAFSLDKPLILSDRVALRDYFGELPRYVDNTVEGLREALAAAFRGELPSNDAVADYRRRMTEDWQQRFAHLVASIQTLI